MLEVGRRWRVRVERRRIRGGRRRREGGRLWIGGRGRGESIFGGEWWVRVVVVRMRLRMLWLWLFVVEGGEVVW